MLLRPYQEVAVSDACKALDKHNNTLVVAPTGAGKTIMLSALVGKRHKKGKRVLVLQHRDELVSQNKEKFERVNPLISTSIVNGTVKHWEGDAVFSMVQTMSRDRNLRDRPLFDMVVIDEGHHAAAPTYTKVIDAVLKDNENAEIVGFTATPNRGDGKGLRGVFNNCAHQIELATLIREGFLVRPKSYVIDLGVGDQLDRVTKRGKEYDMEEVAAIMDRSVINERIVDEWKDKAGDRKTVVFCSTVLHAEHVCEAFLRAGIRADFVTGETPKEDRAEMLHDLEFGDLQVVVNVMVLTEGFDAPPVSCVVLTRPCSQKGTMVQMIGRGLRIVDPEIYPDTIKTNCIVMDFGTSIITHGALDETANLDGSEKNAGGDAPTKVCPECESEVASNTRICPICEHVFELREKSELIDFVMTEYDLMQLSPFMWIDPYGSGTVMMATGFNGFSMVGKVGNYWVAIVKAQNGRARIVSIGEKVQAMSAADDFLREIEDSTAANKSKRWLNQAATPKQKQLLRNNGVQVSEMDFSWTKYKAACCLGYYFNRTQIDRLIADNWKKITGEDYGKV
jgi:superfamily II DNA or RNA helicase